MLRRFKCVQIFSMIVLDLSSLFDDVFRKNLNASKPSEHPPQVEECLKV